MAEVSATDNSIVGGNKWYRYYVLGILTATYTFSIMDRQIVAILVEDLRAEFALSDAQLGVLSGLAFALFYATLGIPIARLADRTNRVRIVSIAVAVWSAMTALCAAAGSFLHLFLARIGVGIGEAGGTPPSHSMISDYFGPNERGWALSIYSMGTSIGGFLGLVIGGFVAEYYGWRAAFLVLGIPGLFLAVLTWLSVREPPRGTLDNEPQTDDTQVLSFKDAAVALWQNLVFRRIIIGHILAIFVGYSLFGWLPALFLRQFDMGQAEVGTLVGLIISVGGIPGLLLGGYLGDKLAESDVRWRVYIPIASLAIATPVLFLGMWTSNVLMACLMFGLGIFLYKLHWGPHLALVQQVVAPALRAQAVAYAMFFSNMLGLGLGPVLIGAISDMAMPSFGEKSLTVALSVSLIAFVLGAFWYVRALRPLRTEYVDTEQSYNQGGA